jgi:hypothetical protein
MQRLLSLLSCSLLAISVIMLIPGKKVIHAENEINPDESGIGQQTINSTVPFSNILTNYTSIGLCNQAGAINCLVVSRTDSNLVLAGSQNGGVWISHNAARTWMPVNDTARSLCVTSMVQNFLRPNEFYYSTGINITENGHLLPDIYRSTDYGQTFSMVHPVTASFGKINKILSSPLDSNTLYVLHSDASYGVGEVYRTTDNCHSFHLVYQVNHAIDDMILLPDGTLEISYIHSVWRSNSGNSGTFVQSTGIDTTGYDTRLAFCESRPDIQYCSVFLYGSYDFYKSIDTGRTWTFVSNQTSMFFGRRMAVKPDDPDFILSGSISTSASVDGGNTWQIIIAGHDLRSYNYDPHRNGKVYVTSDFGISTIEVDPITPSSFNKEYRSDSLLYSQEIYYGDHAATGIQTIQGYQDLGSRYIQNMTQSEYVLSGDGSWVAFSKQNPDVAYFSAQYGDIYRSESMTTTQSAVSITNQLDSNNSGGIDEGTMFIHPFVMNNANDSQLFFPTFHRLWRSTDRGDNWYPVSHWYGNPMADISIACTNKPNPIVYWTNSDSVFVLANAGTALPLSEFGRPVPFDAGRSFTDPNHDSALYIINRSYPPRISYCPNLFATSNWTDIPLTMIPDVTVLCMAVYPGNDQVIFVGCEEGGLYVTLDKGLTWTKELGMPNVQIREIKIRESDKQVFIFTYGRGTWTADFSVPLSVASMHNNSNMSVYPNPFHDYLTIDLDREINGSIELTDMQGKQCMRKIVSGKQIKLSTEDLARGSYLITISAGNKIIYQSSGIRVD